MISIYNMPVSHFCEKVRWALAFKRLPHKYKNLLPGLHIKPMKKLTGQSALPVIKDGKNVIYDSVAIISYLDEHYPRFALTPEHSDDKERAIALEEKADATVGIWVRILVYAEMLERPDLLIPMFAYQGPWYKGFVLNKAFPRIREALRASLPITEESVSQAKLGLRSAVDELQANLGDSDYLVGQRFSRADLTYAALLAPLFQPSAYGVAWPESLPLALQQTLTEFDDIKPWVMRMYAKHR